MSTMRNNSRRLRSGRGRIFAVESLETRALLTAAETFTGPSLTGLIQEARQGTNTAPAVISTMLQSLETQLKSGPLADLNSSAVNGNGFVAEAQSLETSFAQNVDQQLSPAFPNVDALIKLQAQRVVANLISLNQQESVGLITSSGLASQAQTTIGSLTAGPIVALGTPISTLASRTQSLETSLNALAHDLSTTSTTALTASQVNTTLTAEAESYRADMHAALQVTNPNVANTVDTAVNALESAANTATQGTGTNAQTLLTSAITAFDAALLDTTGLFGTAGAIRQALPNAVSLPVNRSASSYATTISNVSGTAASGGTATLSATLTNSTLNQAVSGATVLFTLDGALVGTAVTNSSGVATLSGVTITNTSTNTDTGGVVAIFPGRLNNQSSQGTGNLVVS